MSESARIPSRSRQAGAVRTAARWGLGLWILAGAAWATFAVGDLFQIGKGTHPSVATDDLGNQVMIWQHPEDGIQGRLRDFRGRAIGVEFRVRSGDDFPTDPDVVYLRTGEFVVAWESGDPAQPGIFARRFHRRGRAIGVEFRLDEAGGQHAIGADDRDILVVAWTAPQPPAKGGDRHSYHFVRRFDRAGRAIGVEFQVGERGPATPPALAVRDAGGFLVVWADRHGEIVAQAFDAEGTPVGDTFRVNESRFGDQDSPDVTVALDGSYTVVWERILPGDRGHQVVGRRVSPAGRAIGVEFRVSERNSTAPTSPTVTADRRGHTLVTWISDQGRRQILAREIALEGRAIGVEFRIDATTAPASVQAAPGGNGDFVVIWEGLEPEPWSIYGRDLMLD